MKRGNDNPYITSFAHHGVSLPFSFSFPSLRALAVCHSFFAPHSRALINWNGCKSTGTNACTRFSFVTCYLSIYFSCSLSLSLSLSISRFLILSFLIPIASVGSPHDILRCGRGTDFGAKWFRNELNENNECSYSLSPNHSLSSLASASEDGFSQSIGVCAFLMSFPATFSSEIAVYSRISFWQSVHHTSQRSGTQEMFLNQIQCTVCSFLLPFIGIPCLGV